MTQFNFLFWHPKALMMPRIPKWPSSGQMLPNIQDSGWWVMAPVSMQNNLEKWALLTPEEHRGVMIERLMKYYNSLTDPKPPAQTIQEIMDKWKALDYETLVQHWTAFAQKLKEQKEIIL